MQSAAVNLKYKQDTIKLLPGLCLCQSMVGAGIQGGRGLKIHYLYVIKCKSQERRYGKAIGEQMLQRQTPGMLALHLEAGTCPSFNPSTGDDNSTYLIGLLGGLIMSVHVNDMGSYVARLVGVI